MKFFISKKGIALLVTLVAVGASAFGAYAYFSSGGTGSGTAGVGAVANAWEFNATAADSNQLFPGGTTANISGTIHNQRTDSDLGLNTVTVAITGNSNAPACDASNFALSNSGAWTNNGDGSWTYTEPAGTFAGPGGSLPFPSGLAVAMVETGVSQNECQFATVNLSFTAA